MKVRVYGSGSSGNCATVDDFLILDAGVKCEAKGSVVLVTHRHTDHTKELAQFRGLQVFALEDTIAWYNKNRDPYFLFNRIDPQTPLTLQRGDGVTYQIRFVQLEHDVPCVGFDIERGDGERIFWATDFSKLRYPYNEFVETLREGWYSKVFIECNNSLNASDFADMFDEVEAKDTFHRKRSFERHANVAYVRWLFTEAGFSEGNRCKIPTTLLHKSSYYYNSNLESVINLAKVTTVTNILYNPTEEFKNV